MNQSDDDSGDAAKRPRLRGDDGKIHEDLPAYVPDHWTERELEDYEDELERSIAIREREAQARGVDAPHGQRLAEEKRFLDKIRERLDKRRRSA